MEDPSRAYDPWNESTAVIPEEHRANGSSTLKTSDEETRTRLQKADQKLMNVWGEARGVDMSTTAQLNGSTKQHPILDITNRRPGRGFMHSVQKTLYHAMRKYCSPLDLAIKNRRDIEGNVEIEAENGQVQRDLRRFARRVPVGFIDGAPKRGLNEYLNLMAGAADEFGLSAGETFMNESGRGISRLVVPRIQTLSLDDKNDDGLYELYQTQHDYPGGDRTQERLDDKDRVQTLSFGETTEGPWPRPLAWSLVQTTEVLLRIYESVANGWWRFGDPSLLVTEEYSDEANPQTVKQGDAQIPVSLFSLRETLQSVFKDRKTGEVSDAYHATRAEVNAEVLGNVDNTLMRWFAQHNNVLAGQIIGHAQVPVWMFPEVQLSGEGLNSSRSRNQTVMASVAAHKRNHPKIQMAREILNLYLISTGRSREVGNFRLLTDETSIIDEAVEAEAELNRAQANQIHVQVANSAFADGEPIHEGEAQKYLERHGVVESEE